MSNKQILFENTALIGINKCGELKPDAQGRYEVVFGRVGENAVCTKGEVYDYGAQAQKTFASDSRLMQMASQGLLRGEWGHPKPQGHDPVSFRSRVRMIDEEKICMHIYKIWLEPGTFEGKPTTLIKALIKPAGPNGPYLKEMLDDKEQNVAFSGRYFSSPTIIDGVRHRDIYMAVTWDFVFMPGMPGSTKFETPNLLSIGGDSDFVTDAYHEDNSIVISERDIIADINRPQELSTGTMLSGIISPADLAVELGISAKPNKPSLVMGWGL